MKCTRLCMRKKVHEEKAEAYGLKKKEAISNKADKNHQKLREVVEACSQETVISPYDLLIFSDALINLHLSLC
ncbi:hypothetical protein Lal_00003108 [Lupinus albus]|nr:hypothetical protein Lal_00003108 [Lupinus albus]